MRSSPKGGLIDLNVEISISFNILFEIMGCGGSKGGVTVTITFPAAVFSRCGLYELDLFFDRAKQFESDFS